MTAKYNVHWYKTSWGLVGEQVRIQISRLCNSAHGDYHGIEFQLML